MRFLKYRTTWAWGNGQWEIRLLSVVNYKEYGYKNRKEYIEEEYLRQIHDDHSYSDKYRGVEYNVITLKRLSKKDRAKLVKDYEQRLQYAKDSIPYYEDILKELNGENPTSNPA